KNRAQIQINRWSGHSDASATVRVNNDTNNNDTITNILEQTGKQPSVKERCLLFELCPNNQGSSHQRKDCDIIRPQGGDAAEPDAIVTPLGPLNASKDNNSNDNQRNNNDDNNNINNQNNQNNSNDEINNNRNNYKQRNSNEDAVNKQSNNDDDTDNKQRNDNDDANNNNDDKIEQE
ncbi:MAG: hypothetical protein EZS28_039241, partial [Streblomastix strix]